MARECIYEAIANLPVALLTTDIVEAGVEEGNIKLLDYLPLEFMTSDNIQRILQKNNDSWSSFNLSRFPEEKRTPDVCNIAVKKSIDNLPEVPSKFRNKGMLMELMRVLKKHLHYLPLVPPGCWDKEAVYKGMKSLCSSDNYYSSYGRTRSRYNSYNSKEYENKSAMEKIQVLLTYVPRTIKNNGFYLGLLSHLSVDMAVKLIPDRYKQGKYFELLAKLRPGLVPANKYTYEMFVSVLGPDNDMYIHSIPKENGLYAKMLSLMDDSLADIIITKTPQYFTELPKSFQTTTRFLKVLDNYKDVNNTYGFGEKLDKSLLTKAVCRKYVQVTRSYPEFPREVWNEAFVKYCMENDKTYGWFKQMPRHLQTQQIVSTAMDLSLFNIEYAEPKFITHENACKLNQQANADHYMERFREYIPEVYYENFEIMTGLPREFMGGERSFFNIKDVRSSYTYCTLGQGFAGFYAGGQYKGSATYLILTRRTPMSMKPQTVFNRAIGTYHKTWLEKMIADYDRLFVKPSISKELKKFQDCGYYEVKYQDTVDGIKIYANFFMDEPVLYIAEAAEGIRQSASREELINKLQSKNTL